VEVFEKIPDFKRLKQSLQRRRRVRLTSRLGAAAAVIVPCALLLTGVVSPAILQDWNGGAALNETLAMPEGEQKPADQSFGISSIDARRDPVFLFRETAAKSAPNKFAIKFGSASTATENSGNVFYVSDRMLGTSVQLMTALPALPQDFALMGASSVDDRLAALPGLDGELIDRSAPASFESDAGWQKLGSEQARNEPLTESGRAAEFERIGSSSITILPEAKRAVAPREYFVKALFRRGLGDLLTENGMDNINAAMAADAVARVLNIREMAPGYVAAYRTQATGSGGQVIAQLSLFDGRGLIGGIALTADRSFAAVENPWAVEELAAYSREASVGGSGKRYRIMDGIYSAGVRNDIPPNVISETISQMARVYDLGQFIQRDDKFSLIYSGQAREPGREDGYVLYASVVHAGETLSCYVLKPNRDSAFTCMTDKDTVTEELGPSGFVTPVGGSLRSTFGPRMHPILGVVRLHAGVDWAAPPGTPVKAAFEGTIESAGVDKGFGNLIVIAHANGMSTYYAHLSALADGLKIGQKVASGELIGYVGSTGLSTGPHLHFELRVAGEPVDPLTYNRQIARGGDATNASERLINRIINVESGGNPNAANPLSTAAGLGQFISSTWIRMIRAYRPDIANSMSYGDILNLRYDPTIAREMLYNLTAENEADLRRAGHTPTAGNLYLAHFLGSAGAVQVLNEPDETPIENAVGYGVVSANPFLYGRDVGWIINWAERKMSGRSVLAYKPKEQLPVATRITNSRFRSYSSAIDQLLASIEANKPSG
jgi:murein DD-endopeptidase MepM/ murein hydrolase activator NlpD